ncbi:MAG: hypothetical protein RI945_271 [Candidatus Parcubacteria bacterium]|jgi:hypothetical protein
MTIAKRVERCHGNLGALTHLFLQNRLNLNAQEIFPHLKKAFNEKLESLNAGKEKSMLLQTFAAFSLREGCHVFSTILKENDVVVEEPEEVQVVAA